MKTPVLTLLTGFVQAFRNLEKKGKMPEVSTELKPGQALCRPITSRISSGTQESTLSCCDFRFTAVESEIQKGHLSEVTYSLAKAG